MAGQQRHATSRARARSRVVVDLDPLDRADRGDADLPAAVGELLEAVLVVELRVALARWPAARRRGRSAAAGSISVTPMYSPCAVAGSSALLMRSRCPSPVTWTFISSSPSGFESSTASTSSGPRASSSRSCDRGGVDGVAVGEQDALGELLARAPQRVGVVPLERLLVEHELELQAVAALERRHALGQPVVRVAGDDHRVGRGRRARSWRARRRGSCGRRRRPAASSAAPPSRAPAACPPGRQHHADHSSSSSSSSSSGCCTRPITTHPYTASPTKATPSTIAIT